MGVLGRLGNRLAMAAVAAALIWPSTAGAAVVLQFTGVITSGVLNSQSGPGYPDTVYDSVSLVGYPVFIEIEFKQPGEGPYPTNKPYFSDLGFGLSNSRPGPGHWFFETRQGVPEEWSLREGVGLYSIGSRGPAGGSISIIPGWFWLAAEQNSCCFALDWSWLLSQPHGPFSPYFDPDATGQGSFGAELWFNSIWVSFDITSVRQIAVPEPGAWIMLLLGFGAIGGMARRAQARALQPRGPRFL